MSGRWRLIGSLSMPAEPVARLWHAGGRTSEAHKLLAPVYDRFTEGFATADLRAAKTLLGALA